MRDVGEKRTFEGWYRKKFIKDHLRFTQVKMQVAQRIQSPEYLWTSATKEPYDRGLLLRNAIVGYEIIRIALHDKETAAAAEEDECPCRPIDRHHLMHK